jgi:hypothetical protein
MTLKSALQDVRETTLAAVSGLLGKLSYLASLRRAEGRYEHWGLESVYGEEASERALKTAHGEVVTGILRTRLAALSADLRISSEQGGIAAQDYVEDLRDQFAQLLPAGRENSPAAAHLNSVLVALSSLERNRGHATRSAS